MPLFAPTPLLPQRRPAPPPSVQAATGSVGSAAGTSTAQAFAPFGAGVAAGTSTASAAGASLAAGIGSASGTSTATGATNDIFPLTVSSDGRYLKQNDGTPFLICADSTWSLGVDIPIPTATADINSFLTTITGQGFNSVMMNAIEHHYTVVKPPKERGGNLPFTKRLDGATYTGTPNGCSNANGTQGQFAADNYSSITTQAPDPTFVNGAYWLAVESILNACIAHNVLVFVWPAYLGFHAGDEGWMPEMVQWDAVTGAGGFVGQPWADNTKSKIWNYGAWLADRWKAYPNLIWVMGGDYGSGSQSLNTAEHNAVNNVMAGMKSVAGQQSTLWTAHWNRPCIATDTTMAAGTWDLNLAYCDEAVAETTRSAYAQSPATPAFLGEYNYEDGLFGGSAPWRKYVYWGFLGGIAGGFFGNEQLWRFDDGTPGTDWTTLLTTQATNDVARQFAFWKSRPWWRLRPNGLNSIGTLVTAGGGTASPQTTDYVAAAATPEGDLLLAYVPPAHTGSVTIDMTKLSATVQARWFDPSNATFTNIGGVNNSSTHAFTTTGNNNAGDADWLLVLETVSGAAAGSSTAAAVSSVIIAAAGSAAGSSTTSAVGQSTSATSGTSSGTGTATAAGATLGAGVGNSTATSSAAGVGASLGTSTGTSSGTSTASAVGASFGAGNGTSNGTATAAGVGASLAATTGTAAGSTTVFGQSPGGVAGVGTVAGTSTATGVGASFASTPGSSAGVSTATAVGASFATVTGTSTGSGTAAAGGAALATGTGTSTGSGTTAAGGAALVTVTGTSTGAATATAIGAALAAAAGTSTGLATANAFATVVATTTGSASGTCTVIGQAPASGIAGQGAVVDAGTTVAASGAVLITGTADIQFADDLITSTPLHHPPFASRTQAVFVRSRKVIVIVRS